MGVGDSAAVDLLRRVGSIEAFTNHGPLPQPPCPTPCWRRTPSASGPSASRRSQGWVTDILDAGDTGERVTCVIGFEREIGKDTSTIAYSVAKLDVAADSFEIV